MSFSHTCKLSLSQVKKSHFSTCYSAK